MVRKKQHKKQQIDAKNIRNLIVAFISLCTTLFALFLVIFYFYLLIKSGQDPSSSVFTLATQFFSDLMGLLVEE